MVPEHAEFGLQHAPGGHTLNQSKLVHAPVRGTIFRKWRFCLIWRKTASQDAPGRAIVRESDEEGGEGTAINF